MPRTCRNGILLALTLLAGCASAPEPPAWRDPASRSRLALACRMAPFEGKPAEVAQIAALMGVSADQAHFTFCERVVDGLLAGRVTPDQLDAAANGGVAARWALAQVLSAEATP